MINAYIKCFENYANFSGRCRRSDYWYFILANAIVNLVLSIVTLIVPFLMFLHTLYSLAILVPSIAISVRRLHDVGKSGWLLLLLLIPIVGEILIFVWAVIDSQKGDNRYGANPKGIN